MEFPRDDVKPTRYGKADTSVVAGMWEFIKRIPSLEALEPKIRDIYCMGWRKAYMTLDLEVLTNERHEIEHFMTCRTDKAELIPLCLISIGPVYAEDNEYFNSVFCDESEHPLRHALATVLQGLVPSTALVFIQGPFTGQLKSRAEPYPILVEGHEGACRVVDTFEIPEGQSGIVDLDGEEVTRFVVVDPSQISPDNTLERIQLADGCPAIFRPRS